MLRTRIPLLLAPAVLVLAGACCQSRTEGPKGPAKPVREPAAAAPDATAALAPSEPAPASAGAAAGSTDAFDVATAEGVKALDPATATTLPFVSTPLDEVVAFARKTCRTYWYGVYLGGQKLGYLEMGCGVERHEGQEVVTKRSSMHMNVKMYSSQVRLEVRTLARYATTGVGELLTYEYVKAMDTQRQSLTIQRQASGWLLERTYQAGAIKKPPERQVLTRLDSPLTRSEAAFHAALLAGRIPAGKAFRYAELDPEAGEVREGAIQLLGLATRTVRSAPVKLHKLEVLEITRRVTGEMVVDDDAQWLDGTLQGTIRIRREERATARKVDARAGDLGLGVVIRAPLDARDPGKVKRLRVKLKGFLPQGLKESPRQQLVARGAGEAELTVTREDLGGLPALTLPIKDLTLTKDLEATHQIESGHREIQALAQRALGGERTALGAARKLNQFVFKYLDKKLSTQLDSALAIARARVGDCTEHARLLVALARAVGLPAREVGGVTYVYEMGGFGYHAWVEVWLGRWVAIDPSWNEVPANATHLRMGGPEDIQWIGTLRALSLQVLDAQKD
jgi:hypothetical protein